MNPSLLAFFGLPGGWEWLVILIIGLLIFGGRLPNVARSMGKSIVEFKRGLHDVKDEIDREPNRLEHGPKDDPARSLPSQNRAEQNTIGSADRAPSAQTGTAGAAPQSQSE